RRLRTGLGAAGKTATGAHQYPQIVNTAEGWAQRLRAGCRLPPTARRLECVASSGGYTSRQPPVKVGAARQRRFYKFTLLDAARKFAAVTCGCARAARAHLRATLRE